MGVLLKFGYKSCGCKFTGGGSVPLGGLLGLGLVPEYEPGLLHDGGHPLLVLPPVLLHTVTPYKSHYKVIFFKVMLGIKIRNFVFIKKMWLFSDNMLSKQIKSKITIVLPELSMCI